MELLAGIPAWGQTGIVGVLLATVVYVVSGLIRGTLTSSREVERERQNAATWKDAWEKSQSRHDAVDAQVDAMKEVTDTVRHLIESLPKAGGSK